MPAEPEVQEKSWLQSLPRMILIFIAINSIFGALSPKNKTVITPENAQQISRIQAAKAAPNSPMMKFLGIDEDAPVIPVFSTHDSSGQLLPNHKCVFQQGTYDLKIYVTESDKFDLQSCDVVIFEHVEHMITFDWAYQTSQGVNLDISVTPHMLGNGSIWAHVFLDQVLSDSLEFNPAASAYYKFPLTKYKQKPKPKILKKLLSAPDPMIEDIDVSLSDANETIALYWKPTFHLNNVLDIPHFPRNNIPMQVAKHLHFLEDGDYYPVMYHNEFWTTSKQLIEVNQSTLTVPLSFSFSHISYWKWNMQIAMEEQWRTQQRSGMGGTDKETDMLRETLLETSPWLLAVTAVVSLLHTLFDVLAFKNDIQFWRKKKSMAGMSVHTLGVNCFFQTVILLYLFDNDTSYMILASSAFGLLIEYWKLKKAFNVSLSWSDCDDDKGKAVAVSGVEKGKTCSASGDSDSSGSDRTAMASTNSTGLSENNSDIVSNKQSMKCKQRYFPRVVWSLSASYAGQDTQEHDETATAHLFYVLIPLICGYSIYSLVHNSHKSFYSWALGSLVGFVYAFGFIFMTPQLFINYKLKSVAHMPWRAMVYKSLNTFIDDLFAFVIKMPTLHRLACFRDDLIFFVYLYQKWTYRVDFTRTNEFGQGGGEVVSSDNSDSNAHGDEAKINSSLAAAASAPTSTTSSVVE